MRNLKKLLALIVAICVIATFTVPAFAADAAAAPSDSKICSDLGVLQGDGNGVTDAYLAKGTTRLQAAIVYLRLMGKEDEALAETSTDNFADASKLTWAQGKNVLAYLKKNPSLGWVGDGTNFDPNGAANAQMIYKVMLTALGYVQGTDFVYADAITFAGGKGLTKIASVTALTNNDLATALVEALKAKIKDGSKSLAEDLIAKNIITAAAADATGLVPAYKPVALDVSGAVALNSKVVELSLGTAATDADVAAAAITVKDAAGKAIAVTGAKLAPWSSDGKSVLATLEADTVSGTLYTATVGTKSINFGGKAADTDKPTVSKVESADYNQVKVTFSEAVLIDGATFVVAEKYGSKAALAVSSFKYDSKDTILLSTADQKDATLYGIEVAGAKDLAGNTMDKDTDETFTGTAKNADDLKVTGAYGLNNPEEATVQFNVRVDASTIKPENFKVEEAYGAKTVLPVTAAIIGAKDDPGCGATLVNDVTNANDAAKHVVLTIPGLKDATLYKVTVTGMSSAYGKALASDQSANFSGIKKPTDAFVYDVVGGTATSNTVVDVNFKSIVVKADAENIANYAIAEAYGSKAAVTVTKAELQSDKKTVKLTVSALKAVLYKITITGVKDIYGNSIKTDSDANIVSFSGSDVKAKIGSIKSIAYAAGSETVLVVELDQPAGSSVSDVAHYTIDNSVGYPEKAEAGATAYYVKLTIPKLTVDKVYKLTIKGLENSDGIAMGSDGVSLTFLGKGITAGDPELVAVMATDKQTLKIFFDRDVTDSKIDGATKIWDSSTNSINPGALGYVDADTTEAVPQALVGYAYQATDNKNVLVVRVPVAPGTGFAVGNKASFGSYKLVGASSLFKTDKNKLLFSANDAAVTNVKIDAVMALNKSTIRVYFNQPVKIGNVNFARVGAASNTTYGAAAITLSNPTAVDSTKTVYDFALSGTLTGTSYWLIANTAVNPAALSDTTGSVTLEDLDTSSAGTIEHTKQFAGSGADVSDITGVSILMKDAKTILVYYPAIMDTSVPGTDGIKSTSVKDFDNYMIVNGSDVAVTMADGSPFDPTTDIGDITYDSDSTSDTYNSAKIILNQKITTAAGGAFMKFNNTVTPMKNALGTASVKDGTNALKKQFALSAADAAKVSVSSATYDRATGVLTIKLNQKATSVGSAVYGNFAGTFKITIKTGATTSTVLVNGNVTVTAGPTATTAADEIKVTLGGVAVAQGEVGKVEFATGSNLIGINGEAVQTDSSTTFAQ